VITFGTPRCHVTQCGSTNDLARAWARDTDDPAPSGALVTADFQTRGRGQRGRQWQAGWEQSALMSFVYRLPAAVQAGQLGLVVALAVADALASLTDLDPRLKWPNDILLNGRKVAGILVEIAPPAPNSGGAEKDLPVGARFIAPPSSLAAPELGARGQSSLLMTGEAILGIGVNVNQERFVGADEFVYPPASLRQETGRTLEVERVVAAVALALTQRVEDWRRDGFALILEECRVSLAIGAAVRRREQQAELVGLASSGAAQVRLPGGTFAEWSTVD